ncbi:MAG: hypothetical protein KIS92_01720 [Planctomycetota bacterium]|nr:hypothetical protein [Planctomycetota bacterium]
MRWIVCACAVLAWRACAADAPAPKVEKADAADAAQTENLVIAPKSALVLRSGVVTPGGETAAKPVIVYERNPLTIGPVVAKTEPDAKPAAGQPAQAPKKETKQEPKPTPEDGAQAEAYRMPILRLPIQFPSTSIASAGGPNMRFQTTGDAKLETREIVAPLPLGASYGPPAYSTRIPFAYGQGSAYEKAKQAEPKK